MEAIALIFTKFSEELIAAQLAALCSALALATYLLLIRKKKKESAEWVPAALVRAYLDRARQEERELRLKLFGEDSAAVVSHVSVSAGPSATDPSLLRELDALRSQLSASDLRSQEYDRLMNALRAEKAALEQKLKDAPAAGAGGAVDTGGLKKEVDELRARLQEYEVIEDDLANLKKFQKENETLRQKIEAMEKAPAPAAAPVAAPAPAPSAPPVLSVVQDTPVVIAGGEQAEAAPAEANTNVLEPAAEAAPVSAEKTAKQKEEELLSEFEKMLAS